MRAVRLVLLSALAAVLLSSCSAHDAEAKMRFGWPTGITDQATKMRVLWTWSSVAALVVGVMVWGLIFWASLRYRKKSDALPKQTRYNHAIETTYTLVPFVIIAFLFYFTVKTEDNVNKLSAHPDQLVQVEAFKWNWQFSYLQDHGAAVKNAADDKAVVSTVGSTDEIPVLVIPVGEKVQFIEHSEDVIHSFWVPEFLFKRDVIPYGTEDTKRDNRFEITATTTGSYVGRCAELCGTYHSQMNFEVRVVQPDVYEHYLESLKSLSPDDPARQSKALASIGQTPYATTTHPFNSDRLVKSAS